MGRIYRRGERFLSGAPRSTKCGSSPSPFRLRRVLRRLRARDLGAGTRVETNKSTTAIVENGQYRFTRNPIYICMFLGQAGLEMGFNSAWILATLAPFYFVIRFSVIARQA